MASDKVQENYVQPAIPRFDGHYDHWSMLMENFLRSKEYWILIETGIVESEGVLTEAQQKKQDEMKLKDLKVKNYLFQAIDRTILETILEKTTSKQIWESMKKKYQGSTKVRRSQLQALRREFETLQMKEGESVADYFSRTMSIANKMQMNGESITNVAIVEKILRSMTPRFDYIVCTIEESNNVDELTIDELQSSLLVHEQKVNRSTTKEEQALKSSTHYESSSSRGRGRGRSRGRGGRGNRDGGRPHGASVEKADDIRDSNSQSRGRGRRQQYDKFNIECFRCHKFGHYRSECYTKLPKDKEKEEKSNFVEKQEAETLLMACHIKEEADQNLWYLDTGCSNHMCGNKDIFSVLDESFRTIIRFGDNSIISVIGKGDVQIRSKDNTLQTISNVFYVPDLKSNLLSVGQLQEKGYVITIKGGTCLINDPKKGAIAQVKMTANRMFPLHIKHDVHSCFSAKVKDPTWLWHFRYGHLNFNGLKTLHVKEMVIGLPQINCPSQVCEECVVGKHN